MQTRTCNFCGGELVRKKYKNGAIESRKQFISRKFCDGSCSKQYYLENTNQYCFSEDGLVGYATVPGGEIFIFDADDYAKIYGTKWYQNHGAGDEKRYIVSQTGLRLHRLIIDAPTNLEVDHINLNPLDNRKMNLRICTHRQNQCNQPPQRNNTSGVSGVRWVRHRQTWQSRIKYYGVEIHLGTYHSFLEAVQARNEGMRWLFGEFGIYNDSPEAPAWIKEGIANKCSRYIDAAAMYFCSQEEAVGNTDGVFVERAGATLTYAEVLSQ